MRSFFSQILEDVLLRAAGTLFLECGIEHPERNGDAVLGASDDEVAATIGFRGDTLRGSLMLVCAFHVAARTRPGSLSSAPLSSKMAKDWILARDWVGELSNQLLGRMKNRLLASGVDFVIAAPVPLSGRGLHLALKDHCAAPRIAFGRGADVVWVLVNILEEPKLPSTRPLAVPDQALEGDVIEF